MSMEQFASLITILIQSQGVSYFSFLTLDICSTILSNKPNN